MSPEETISQPVPAEIPPPVPPQVTAPEFKMKLRREPLAVVVTIFDLTGELDSFFIPEFRKKLLDVAEGLNPYIILNLKNLSFICSSGLGFIISTIKRLRKLKSGKLVLCQIHPNLEMLFEMILPGGAPAISFMTEEGAVNEFRNIKPE